MVICTLGDLLLDVVVRPEGVAAAGDDRRAEVAVTVGGQAANVAAWAAHLGARARLVAVRADDAVGRLVAAELAGRGVQVVGPVVAGTTGTVVALLDGGGERAMMSDRGVSPEFPMDLLDPAWFGDIDRLHITGYSLIAEPFAFTAIAAAHHARVAGARVSVDLSAAHLIEAVGATTFTRRLAAVHADVIFATADELAAAGGAPEVPVLVTKRGAGGVTVRWPAGSADIPAPAVAVTDSTGAGDAFAAGFLLGATRDEAVDRARDAAATCLGMMGAMPPSDQQGARM